MPREIEEEKSERGGQRIVSEQIKNAWLCSGWCNNECPHSLPVTSGNSWDRVEEGEEERSEAEKRMYQQFIAGSNKEDRNRRIAG